MGSIRRFRHLPSLYQNPSADGNLEEKLHCTVWTDGYAHLAGDALVLVKTDRHGIPVDPQRLGGTESRAGRTVGATFFQPLHILGKPLGFHPQFFQSTNMPSSFGVM